MSKVDAAPQKQPTNYLFTYFHNHRIFLKWPLMVILTFVLLKNVLSQSIVETLPGYEGLLPFKLETGYIGVGEKEEVELFYYYIESESDPVNDPLILWLTGGPGCSGFNGLIFEIGPLIFDYEAFDGSFPSFLPNPYSWSKVAGIIFVDSPAGAGYSYAKTSEGYHSSDTKTAENLYTFLRKWLLKHPQLLKNRLYISGDSYAGKWVPMLAWKISSGNEAGFDPFMRLQGYTIGNPYVDAYTNANAQLILAHRLALISDKYFQMAKSSCNGDYVNPDPQNSLCVLALQNYKQCISNIYPRNVLDPYCKKNDLLEDKPSKILLPGNQGKVCRQNYYFLTEVWSNDPSVLKALHIRKGTIKEWIRCNYTFFTTPIYDFNVESAVQYHHLLSKKRYHALVYSGDHDMEFPYIGTLDTVYKLNLTVDDDWRDWMVDDEVAGYTQKFTQDGSGFYLTFATVKGAGHTAPEYKPKECFAMLQRFISYYPL